MNILDKVHKLLTGEKREDYGEAKEFSQTVTEYWTTYIAHKYNLPDDFRLHPEDFPQMMLLFKIAREQNKHKPDNIVDQIGYGGVTAMVYGEYNDEPTSDKG